MFKKSLLLLLLHSTACIQRDVGCCRSASDALVRRTNSSTERPRTMWIEKTLLISNLVSEKSYHVEQKSYAYFYIWTIIKAIA